MKLPHSFRASHTGSGSIYLGYWDAQRIHFEVAAFALSRPNITPQSAISEFISWRICTSQRVSVPLLCSLAFSRCKRIAEAGQLFTPSRLNPCRLLLRAEGFHRKRVKRASEGLEFSKAPRPDTTATASSSVSYKRITVSSLVRRSKPVRWTLAQTSLIRELSNL